MRTAFCFDLDNTITRQEILPVLAHDLGLAEDMAALTRLTMDGLLPFDSSLRLRCEILKQVPLARARSLVAAIPLEHSIVRFIAERAADCFVVTGNLDVWIEDLLHGLQCRAFTSEAEHADGRLTGLRRIVDKAAVIGTVRSLGYGRVVVAGDGMNDVPMLEAADVAIAFGTVRAPAPAAVAASRYVVYSGEALCRLLHTL